MSFDLQASENNEKHGSINLVWNILQKRFKINLCLMHTHSRLYVHTQALDGTPHYHAATILTNKSPVADVNFYSRIS